MLFVTLDSPPALVTVEKLECALLEKSTAFDPLKDFLITDESFSSPGFSRTLNGVDECAIICIKLDGTE